MCPRIHLWNYLRGRGLLLQNVLRYAYRPFDLRWLYWEAETKLLDEKRADYRAAYNDGDVALVMPNRQRREWSRPQCVCRLADINILDGSANIHLSNVQNRLMIGTQIERRAGKLSLSVMMHSRAVLYSQEYLDGNSGAISLGWPKIPIPKSQSVREFE